MAERALFIIIERHRQLRRIAPPVIQQSLESVLAVAQRASKQCLPSEVLRLCSPWSSSTLRGSTTLSKLRAVHANDELGCPARDNCGLACRRGMYWNRVLRDEAP